MVPANALRLATAARARTDLVTTEVLVVFIVFVLVCVSAPVFPH